MSDAEHMESESPAVAAIVYFGQQYVEIEDPSSVTLHALCEAFGLGNEATSAAYIRCRPSQQVVATLPFETLAEIPPPVGVEGACAYDLLIRGKEDAVAVKMEPTKPLSGPVGEIDAESRSGKAGVAAVDGAHPPARESDERDEIDEALRQLVCLGAVPLLGKEDPRFSALDPYLPSASPGLLTSIVYPSWQYSPFRIERDPLLRVNLQNQLREHRRSQQLQKAPVAPPVSMPPAGAKLKPSYCMVGVDYKKTTAPYTSSVEQYATSVDLEMLRAEPDTDGDAPRQTGSTASELEAGADVDVVVVKRRRLDEIGRARPDLVRQTEAQARDVLDGLMAVAAQAKAAFTLADLQDKKLRPEDVKPKVEPQTSE